VTVDIFDKMKRLLPILLLMFSVGVGAFNEGDVEMLLATNKCLECDLSGADLRGASLVGANLTGANLSGADLSNVNLNRADLSGANLYAAVLCQTRMPDGSIEDGDCKVDGGTTEQRSSSGGVNQTVTQ
jgi:hypothetical protein